MTLPRKWATTTNYSGGIDVGTPCRVDPGAGVAAEGVQPHGPLAAQHFNSLLGQTIDALYEPIEQPEAYAEIREDFTSGFFETTDNILYATHVWQVTEGAINITAAAGANPGQAFDTLNAGDPCAMSLSPFATPLQWGDIQEATFVAGVVSSDLADLNNGEAFFGLASQFTTASNLGANVVGLWFDEATSANWMIRHKVNGVDDATLTSVPVVRNEFVVCKLHRISATQVEVSLNGDVVATLTDSTTAPDDNDLLTPGMMAIAGGGISLTFGPCWDMCYVRWNTPNRAS